MDASVVDQVQRSLRDLDSLVSQSCNVLDNVPEAVEAAVPKCARKRLEASRAKIASLTDQTSRRHLKVAFFGRTSSGKSTAINALLGQPVLPTGLGHTTSCFVEVRGASQEEPNLLVPMPKAKDDDENVENREEQEEMGELDPKCLSEVVNSLGTHPLGPDVCVRLLWPRRRCALFRHDDVVLMDSPGVDVDADFDVWIDRLCADADLFVWVMNGESTLMRREKKFFEEVADKIAKPNIIVLVNRWDCAVEEEEYFIHAAHSQHVERTSEFLVANLKVASSLQEAERRIFFVSAKEALVNAAGSASKADARPASECSVYTRLQEERRNEWLRFTTHISQSLQTSFQGSRYLLPLESCLSICHDLQRLNHAIGQACQDEDADNETSIGELRRPLETLEQGMEQLTGRLKLHIQNLLNDVETMTGCCFDDELERIGDLVDDFHATFHDDGVIVDVYRQQLVRYVESALISNLGSRLSSQVSGLVEQAQHIILARISSLLPADKRDLITDILPRRMPLDFNHVFHYHKALAEFREDLRFRFSLSPSRMFRGYFRLRRFCLRLVSGTTRSADSEDGARAPDSDNWRRLAQGLFAASLATSEASVASLTVLGAAYRTVSWKVPAALAALYGLAYACQLAWWRSSGAKEARLKAQFGVFARHRLADVGPFLAAHCRDQVQKELVSTLVLACGAAEAAGVAIGEELNRLLWKRDVLKRTIAMTEEVVDSIMLQEQQIKDMRRELLQATKRR